MQSYRNSKHNNSVGSSDTQTFRRSLDTRSWWRHQMETFSALLAICGVNSPVTCDFPTQRPVTPSFDVFFDLRLNKRLSKKWLCWWFESPSQPLWRHCNALTLLPPTHSIAFLLNHSIAHYINYNQELIICSYNRMDPYQVCTSPYVNETSNDPFMIK